MFVSYITMLYRHCIMSHGAPSSLSLSHFTGWKTQLLLKVNLLWSLIHCQVCHECCTVETTQAVPMFSPRSIINSQSLWITSLWALFWDLRCLWRCSLNDMTEHIYKKQKYYCLNERVLHMCRGRSGTALGQIESDIIEEYFQISGKFCAPDF